MKKNNIEVAEEIILDWLLKKRHKLFILTILSIGMIKISQLPYLNLFLTKEIIIMVNIILVIIVFSIKSIFIYRSCILLLFVAYILHYLGRMEDAEFIGNILYIALFSAMVKDSMVNR